MYILRARPQAWNARPGMLGLGPFRPSSAWYIFVLRRRRARPREPCGPARVLGQ